MSDASGTPMAGASKTQPPESLLDEAKKVGREGEVVVLADADWQLLNDALANPPAPNAALRKAFEAYRSADE